jgi:hypothetical protein
MKPAITLALLATGLALAAHGFALADPGPSLNQVRSEINSGTWPGITIFKAQPKAEPPPATASAPGGSGAKAQSIEPGKGAAAPARDTPSVAARLGAQIGWGGPLSRQPLNAAKRLDSPSLGIALPTASPGATAASAPSTK